MKRKKEPTGWLSFKDKDDALEFMKGRDLAQKDEEREPAKVTDIDALSNNVEAAVSAFNERWIPAPRFDIGVEVMDVGRLRDAMGLRASIDWGDPWPAAEKMLLDFGFRWQWLGGQRVMYLTEKADYTPDTGWEEAEEVCDADSNDQKTKD